MTDPNLAEALEEMDAELWPELTPEEREARQAEWNAAFIARVDAALAEDSPGH